MKKICQGIFLILAFFVITISGAIAQNWEIDFVSSVNPNYPHSKFWLGTTNSSKIISVATPVSMLALSFINNDKQLQKQSLETFGSLAITIVATEAIKYTVDRMRPYQKYKNIYPNEFKDGQSFPSGHASVAFATATSLSLQYKKWYVVAPAFAWASAVGYSRMYLGQHYPTDIVASAVVGSGSAWISHKATKWFFKK